MEKIFVDANDELSEAIEWVESGQVDASLIVSKLKGLQSTLSRLGNAYSVFESLAATPGPNPALCPPCTDDDAKQSSQQVEIEAVPAKMKGLVKRKAGVGFEYVSDLEVPEPGPGEVLVKSYRVGICGSDLILYSWTKAAALIAALPFTPGHEAAGMVVKAGDGAGIKPGERVAIENHFYCGKCFQCQRGRGDICSNMSQFGHGKGTIYGGCSEYFIVQAKYCYRLQYARTSWRDAALLEPMGVALNACDRAEVESDIEDTVLVIGAGTIGCLAAGVCKAYKAKKVIVFDVIDWKLEKAKKMGADLVVNTAKCNFDEVRDLINKETNGVGVGRIIECSGHAKTVSNMFKLLRKGGNVVLVGLPKQDLVFDSPMPDLVFKSLTLRSIHGRRIFETWQKCERLVANKLIELDHVVTQEIDLSSYEEGYKALKEGKALKVIFDPTK